MSFLSSSPVNKRNLNALLGGENCIADPYYWCDASKPQRSVLALHFAPTVDFPRDQFYAQTLLLCNFDQGSVIDQSAAGRTLTRLGNISNVVQSSLFDSGFCVSNPTSDPAAAYVTPFDVNATNAVSWTFECSWVPTVADGAVRAIFNLGNIFSFFTNAGNQLAVFTAGGGTTNLGAYVVGTRYRLTANFFNTAPNAWNYTLFVNGVNVTSGAGAVLTAVVNDRFYIGNNPALNAGFNGFIGDIRVTQQARYFSATPYTIPPFKFPVTGLANATDTSCATPKTPAYSGDATPQNTFPLFGNQSLYAPRIASGNNTDNGIVVAPNADFNFGTGEWTMTFWAYRFANTAAGYLMKAGEAAGGTMFAQFAAATGAMQVQYSSSGGNQITGALAAIPLNTWTHIAIQRRGNTFETYLGGVLIDSRAVTGGAASTVNLNGSIYIARDNISSPNPINGCIGEVRFWKGAAIYTGANFTPPVSPWCDHQ